MVNEYLEYLYHSTARAIMAFFTMIIYVAVALATVLYSGGLNLHTYSNQMAATTDSAFPLLVRNLILVGIRGFVLAAISGAVISSLASMLNSASTIFTMDLYKRH